MLLSPNGATGNSQGRKPLESGTLGKEPCKGGTQREQISECRPYRAPRQNYSITRGLRPWLFPVAPLGLKSTVPFVEDATHVETALNARPHEPPFFL